MVIKVETMEEIQHLHSTATKFLNLGKCWGKILATFFAHRWSMSDISLFWCVHSDTSYYVHVRITLDGKKHLPWNDTFLTMWRDLNHLRGTGIAPSLFSCHPAHGDTKYSSIVLMYIVADSSISCGCESIISELLFPIAAMTLCWRQFICTPLPPQCQQLSSVFKFPPAPICWRN